MSHDLHDSEATLPLHREAMAQFTGKWPTGYRPRWKRRAGWHLTAMLLSLGGGMAASHVLILGPPAFWPLVVLSWMITVHGARKGQLVINHYGVHGKLTGRKGYDRLIVEVVSTLLVTQDYRSYYRDHIKTHHHPQQLATAEDPDMQFLLALGFRPGMSRRALWQCLYTTIISPRFHYLFIRERLTTNFMSAPGYRRLMAGLHAAAVSSLLFYTGSWALWVAAWGIPLLPLYHIAALLQFVSEHRWGRDHPVSTHKHTDHLTFGRFAGDSLPARDLSMRDKMATWSRWTLRLLFLHIPTRLCVLPGDLAQHDWHHRHPGGDWSNAGYERQRDLDAGCPGWHETYEEIWGLDRAIQTVFDSMARSRSLPATSAQSGA
ncbi:fatty acid desaturase [Candidatus Entotheonella palauensis]|uniref:Fatty acid desaturase domain-containing protein n=1 Tax=Candidatus Entotheonella gemina TaxID=1429439 RepID=W4LS96_9BACT|nr:fatty acid desaturase [Candidatus Entotheonella palauensis]ETX00914.1 MAG: hypothetical protein ETSY2_38180 [Candidatus Entotheonella gemina]